MKIKLLISVLVLSLVGLLGINSESYANVSPTPTENLAAQVNNSNEDSDNDGYSDLCEYLHKSNPNDSESKPSSNITINVPSDVKTIQGAINASIDGDTIVVSQGKYKGNINFNGKSIILTSTDPDNPDVVANTIIEGTETGSVITIDSNSILKGFTITSKGLDCRGIYCKDASPTIENCTIIDNQTTESGGGIYNTANSSPQIINCIITGDVEGGNPQITESYIEDEGLVADATESETTTITETTTEESTPQPTELQQPTNTEIDSTVYLVSEISTIEETSYQTTETGYGEIYSAGWDTCNDYVDIFLLFDDTGSFEGTDSLVKTAFADIISEVTTEFPGISFGFGVGRFEDYGGSEGSAISDEYLTGRPFILNQPIITTDTPGFNDAINAALQRTAPGYGGDNSECTIEGLYQTATGAGYDGNNNDTTIDSGPAGLYLTQTNPGVSGDVPAFDSFTPDLENNVLPPAGSLGGVGFRFDALKIVILATDIGTAYQPDSPVIDPIIGADEVEVPLEDFIQGSRNTTPFGTGAKIQETITALNDLGILVIGLGTNTDSNIAPRRTLEAISKATGTINLSNQSLDSGISGDPIDLNDPLYFYIEGGVGSLVSDGIGMLLSYICISPGWYVDDDAEEGGDGTTWETAFKYLQDALAVASTCDQIWVAQGTYKPDQGTNRYATFRLINGVTLKGSYAGIGASNPYKRDIDLYETILSGDIGIPDYSSDNSYHVVTGNSYQVNVTGHNIDATTIIDGFIIEDGCANISPSSGTSEWWASTGAGMLNIRSSPIVNNCTFRNNNAVYGGGGAIGNVDSTPEITNCTFIGNKGGTGWANFWAFVYSNGGGAIYSYDSSPQITNCTFINNYASPNGGAINAQYSQSEITNCIFSNNRSRYDGGAINNQSYPNYPIEYQSECSSMTITNCVFAGNDCGQYGGALSNKYSSVVVTNSTFTRNYAVDQGGGVFNSGNEEYSSATLVNCIIWGNWAGRSGNYYKEVVSSYGNIDISYCNIKDGYSGEGNIDSDPFFVDPDNPAGPDDIFRTSDDGLRIRYPSSCIDAANGDSAPLTDITGLERIDIAGIPNTGIPIPINYADIGAYEFNFVGWTTYGIQGGLNHGVGEFENLWGICYDSASEYIYVADYYNNCIVKTKINGDGWTALFNYHPGIGQFSYPNSIYYDSDSGYIYVADTKNHRIVKTNKLNGGTDWATYGTYGDWNSGEGHFGWPTGIYYDSDSEYIYVADPGNDRIVKTKMNGYGWTTFGSKGSGVGQFYWPQSIHYDSDSEYIYVADLGNDRIVKTKINGDGWIPYGTYGSGVGQFIHPSGIYYDNAPGEGYGYIYVADTGNGRIVKTKLNPEDGTFTNWAPFGSIGSGVGQFKSPRSIYYDSDSGYIYVADTNNHRIVKAYPEW